ncbi:hypothetical protein [Cognatishimia sp.]|uniref:hypothetical protein n=1 Tax=Cognatishimia sp. TaxID=2211648 RepID=UPI0035143AE5
MRKFAVVFYLLFAAGPVFAQSVTTAKSFDPTLFAGVSWVVGPVKSGGSSEAQSRAGLSLRILTSKESGAIAGAAGVTRYFDGTFGCDAGIAYNRRNQSYMATYDFCKRKPLASIGGIAR